MDQIIELSPVDGRKSFWGKAKVKITPRGEKILISYTTEVCKVNRNNSFEILWNGKSQTTSRHIKAFKAYCGLPF